MSGSEFASPGYLKLLEKFSDSSFKELAKKSALCATVEDIEFDSACFEGVEDHATLKQAYGALCTLLVVSTQNGTGSSGVANYLEECGLSTDRIKFVVSCYESNQEATRATFASTALGHSHLVDIDWRLDYHVQSSATGKANVPMYFVGLKTQDSSGKLHVHKFRCSLQQLQDLASRVQDAHQQVVRTQQALVEL